jgi:chromosome segregation ATPase
MKIENEKIALERSAKKEVDTLKSRMEDINDELEMYRRDGVGMSKEEVEKMKKAAQIERDSLSKKVDMLEDEIQRRKKEVTQLERRAAGYEELEAELSREKQTRADIELALKNASRSNLPVGTLDNAKSDAEVERLTIKIAKLESELEDVRSASPPTVVSGDVALRQAQRQLKLALSENENLKADLKESDETIARLSAHVPLPIDDSFGTSSPSDNSNERVQTLEAELASLRSQLERVQFDSREEIKCLEKELEEASKDLEAARLEIRSEKAAFTVYRGEMEVCHPLILLMIGV